MVKRKASELGIVTLEDLMIHYGKYSYDVWRKPQFWHEITFLTYRIFKDKGYQTWFKYSHETCNYPADACQLLWERMALEYAKIQESQVIRPYTFISKGSIYGHDVSQIEAIEIDKARYRHEQLLGVYTHR